MKVGRKKATNLEEEGWISPRRNQGRKSQKVEGKERQKRLILRGQKIKTSGGPVKRKGGAIRKVAYRDNFRKTGKLSDYCTVKYR